jgi:hypothetical protein
MTLTAICDRHVVFLGLTMVSRMSYGAGKPLPGPAISSPDGKWEITSQEPKAGSDEHTLSLSTPNGERKAIARFRRHAEILWAPDSNRVAMSEYLASDESDCRVLQLASQDAISVLEAIKHTDLAEVVKGNHHVYVKCRRWMNPRTLEFEIKAYGDRNPKGTSIVGKVDVTTGAIER